MLVVSAAQLDVIAVEYNKLPIFYAALILNERVCLQHIYLCNMG
jgi:hypothetical protein